MRLIQTLKSWLGIVDPEEILKNVTSEWTQGRELAHKCNISYGSFYVGVRKLCERGLVELLDLEDSNRPPIRFYRLKP